MKKTIFLLSGVIIMQTKLFASNLPIPSYKNVDFKPPKIKTITLENGIKLYIQKDQTLPLIRLSLLIKTGKVYDPIDMAGLGELFFETLRDGGSKKFKSEDIDKKLEYLGAEILSRINNEDANISMFSHKKNFDEVFEIFGDLVKNPAFELEKFNLKKQESIEMIKRRNDNPDKQASREAVRMFFGKDHPYGVRAEIETVEKITVNDLKKYHENYFKSNNLLVVVAGDFDENEMINKIKNTFESIPKGDASFPKIDEPKLNNERKIYLIDKPIRQTFIVILNKGIRRHDPKEYALTVLSEYMGGGIQSKLGNEIRSKRGLAYSVYSYFAKRDLSGFIITYLGTKPESVYQAINQIFIEMEKARKGEIDLKEFEMAKSQIINSFVFRFPNAFSLLAEKAGYDLYGYEEDYLENYVKNINNVKLEDIIEIAKEYYDTQNPLIFVVGDSKKFDKPLETLGKVEILKED
ncbi:MAG: insulinase family protein [Elusimicrobiota bacterium]